MKKFKLLIPLFLLFLYLGYTKYEEPLGDTRVIGEVVAVFELKYGGEISIPYKTGELNFSINNVIDLSMLFPAEMCARGDFENTGIFADLICKGLTATKTT